MKGLKVKLTYFKTNGKYYTKEEYTTSKCDLYEIWEEVEAFQKQGILPGLFGGVSEFIILVDAGIDIPKHVYEHPRLIMPNKKGGE